jgi:hypothetical protein
MADSRGACVGSAAFFERNCDEISKLTELITTGLTRSPEKQNGKKPAKKATTPPIWSAGAHIPVGFCGEYGACVGSAAFSEHNCDEINKLTELITMGLTRSPRSKTAKSHTQKTTEKNDRKLFHTAKANCNNNGLVTGRLRATRSAGPAPAPREPDVGVVEDWFRSTRPQNVIGVVRLAPLASVAVVLGHGGVPRA